MEFTPLHCASRENCVKVAELLVVHGASLTATDMSGRTARDIAKTESMIDLISPTNFLRDQLQAEWELQLRLCRSV